MDDLLEFWRTRKQSFPRLFEIVKQTLFTLGSTAGIERIFSVADFILSGRCTSTSDDNFENQLFANVYYFYERDRERERRVLGKIGNVSRARKVGNSTRLVPSLKYDANALP